MLEIRTTNGATTLVDPKQISDGFMKFFSEMGRNLSPKEAYKLITMISIHTRFYNHLSLRILKKPKFINTIMLLKDSKQPGHDGITADILKLIVLYYNH